MPRPRSTKRGRGILFTLDLSAAILNEAIRQRIGDISEALLEFPQGLVARNEDQRPTPHPEQYVRHPNNAKGSACCGGGDHHAPLASTCTFASNSINSSFPCPWPIKPIPSSLH